MEQPERSSVSFDLATVFPPTDEVGHFVISLAAAQNDLTSTLALLFPPDNPDDPRVTPAIRASPVRTLLAQIWETQDLVRVASKKPTIKKFMQEMGDNYPRTNLD